MKFRDLAEYSRLESDNDKHLSHGIWTIAPEENCPPVEVKVWVRVRVSFREGGGGEAIFLWGNYPRTLSHSTFLFTKYLTDKRQVLNFLVFFV